MALVDTLLATAGGERTQALRKHARSLNAELLVRLEEKLAGTSQEDEAAALRQLRGDIWEAVEVIHA